MIAGAKIVSCRFEDRGDGSAKVFNKDYFLLQGRHGPVIASIPDGYREDLCDPLKRGVSRDA
jgi:hypothetical protein